MRRHVRLVLGLELRRSRAGTFWLAVVTVVYAGLVTAMYPIIQKNSALIEQYIAMFPKGFAEAFGMSGSLAAPGVFFATYIGMFLWPILAAIVAILVAARTFAGDVDRGWSEIPLATPLTRTSLALASIIAQATVLAVLTVTMVGTVLLVGAVVGAPFDAGRFAIAGLVLLLFGSAVAAVTTLVAVATLSRGMAGGLTAGILLLMYLFNVVATLQPDLGLLADVSAFKYLSTSALIDRGASPVESLVVLGSVTLLGWVGAVLIFRRRDLVA